MKIIMKVFAERLKKVREEREYSQRQLAKILDTSQATINNWENNHTEPSLETITRLAELFKVPICYFFGED